MKTPVLDRVALTGVTVEGETAVLSLRPTAAGLEVAIDVEGGPSATSAWGAKVLTDLTTFFSDPDLGGGCVTVWRGRVPAAMLSVKADGLISLTVLDHGFATMTLGAVSTKSFRDLLASLAT